jgi:hypothetical protein
MHYFIITLILILTGLNQTSYAQSGAQTNAGDPDLKNQYIVKSLKLNDVWELATGKNSVIASCESGIYTFESDLQENLLLEHARDFSDQDNPTSISDGKYVRQGTASTAMMVASKNQYGINGIAWNAKLAPLQYYNYDETDDIPKYDALNACLKHASGIPNVSVIYTSSSSGYATIESITTIRKTIRSIIKSGITVVLPAGNNFIKLNSEFEFPTGSIIVGSLRSSGEKSNYSNYGPAVTISSFGEGIRTLVGPYGKIGLYSGSQNAAAQVAAAIALIKEVNSSLTPSEISNILQSTALRKPNNTSVGGQLNILGALIRSKKLLENY